MDQAASADQALLRKLDERSQDSSLDRGVHLRVGGDIEEGASTTTKFTQHFTNCKREHASTLAKVPLNQLLTTTPSGNYETEDRNQLMLCDL